MDLLDSAHEYADQADPMCMVIRSLKAGQSRQFRLKCAMNRKPYLGATATQSPAEDPLGTP